MQIRYRGGDKFEIKSGEARITFGNGMAVDEFSFPGPGEYEKGKEIIGLDEAAKLKDVIVFHAGTKKSGAKYLTNGGRVLGVTGLGNNIKDAIDKAYQAVGKISFDRMHYRRDIGRRAYE